MTESSNTKKQLSTAKLLVEGFNFFKSGNVVKVSICSRDNKSFKTATLCSYQTGT